MDLIPIIIVLAQGIGLFLAGLYFHHRKRTLAHKRFILIEEKEKVQGFLYYIDKQGDVFRAKKKGSKLEHIHKVHVAEIEVSPVPLSESV